MKYLIEITPPVELANAADDKGGPGPVFGYLVKRFRPEVMYGSALQRSLMMILDLPTVDDLAELMIASGRSAAAEPRVVPLIDADALLAALQRTNGAPRLA